MHKHIATQVCIRLERDAAQISISDPERKKYVFRAVLNRSDFKPRQWLGSVPSKQIAHLYDVPDQLKNLLGTQLEFQIFRDVYAIKDGKAEQRNPVSHRALPVDIENSIYKTILQNIVNEFGIGPQNIKMFEGKEMHLANFKNNGVKPLADGPMA